MNSEYYVAGEHTSTCFHPLSQITYVVNYHTETHLQMLNHSQLRKSFVKILNCGY